MSDGDLPATESRARTYAPDFLQELFANPLDAGYADAAERRARSGPPSGKSHRTGFLVRMIALVATGLLLAVAYQQTVAAQPETSKVQAGLVSDVRDRQATTDAQQRQADALRTEVTKLRDAQIGTSGAQTLRDLEASTGLAAVKGDGVQVTMSDGPPPVDPVTGAASGQNLGAVLDSDLQTVANELWHDGAEAIAINGQRLISTTTIRTAGSAILVDFVPITQPYVISAIGGPHLADSLGESPTGAQYERFVNTYGMHFTIVARDNLSLSAAPDPQLRYATALQPSPTPSARSSSATSSSPPLSPSPSGGR
jgi:uncharacterized protein YlxW (UPF0749 family)